MTERPILFSGPMVRALLAGTKTQTRRIVKATAPPGAVDAGVISSGDPKSDGLWWWLDCKDLMDASPLGDEFRCPYGVPGDLLWVRESWGSKQADAPGTPGGRKPQPEDDLLFMADPGSAAQWGRGLPSQGGFVWRPSIHMPRWASRISLRITDVRVERLNEISEADAKAEGIVQLELPAHNGRRNFGVENMGSDVSPICHQPTAGRAYRFLWERINGVGSWATNPWVWAVTFERIQP